MVHETKSIEYFQRELEQLQAGQTIHQMIQASKGDYGLFRCFAASTILLNILKFWGPVLSSAYGRLNMCPSTQPPLLTSVGARQ